MQHVRTGGVGAEGLGIGRIADGRVEIHDPVESAPVTNEGVKGPACLGRRGVVALRSFERRQGSGDHLHLMIVQTGDQLAIALDHVRRVAARLGGVAPVPDVVDAFQQDDVVDLRQG
ncbi:hypothetical protein D3C87_1257880 [compost metagenome]